jgi:hypothetical protein
MSSANVVTGTFTLTRNATAAVDWFLNQSIDRDAVSIRVAGRGEPPREPRAGDNRRADLTWSVSVDLSRSRLNKKVVVETMKREGGKL